MRASVRADQAECTLEVVREELADLRRRFNSVTGKSTQMRERLDELETGLASYERRTVLVHQQGPSIRGVLIHDYRDCIVLRHAKSLDQDTDLGGEVVILKTLGVWMQVVDPEVTR